MKTTIELPDALFREAKEYAARNGIPFREVMVRGLQNVVHPPRPSKGRFRLKTITTKGEGLVCDGDWPAIRALSYEGHGG
jgi:hypothetical protein